MRRTAVAVAVVMVVTGPQWAFASALEPDDPLAMTEVAEPLMDADGWIYYNRTAPASSTVSTVQGSVVDGQCTFVLSGEVNPGDPATEQVELAHNPGTCESRFAVTELSHATAAGNEARENASEVAHAGSARGQDAGTHVPAGAVDPMATRKKAFQSTRYEDPPGWDVTYAANSTDWRYSGGCVTSATNSWNQSWLTPSGWTRQSNSFTSSRVCARSTSASDALFSNSVFCTLLTGYPSVTFNRYYPNRIQGKSNGGYTWYSQYAKTGGCTNFLAVKLRNGYQ